MCFPQVDRFSDGQAGDVALFIAAKEGMWPCFGPRKRRRFLAMACKRHAGLEARRYLVGITAAVGPMWAHRDSVQTGRFGICDPRKSVL